MFQSISLGRRLLSLASQENLWLRYETEALFFFFFNVYLLIFERERESTNRGGTKREEERESQAASALSAKLNAGLDLTTLGS